ncbi:COMM domain-containing protein 2 isoform X2 [Zonotrichia albicollis]|uniref:COMM domain-containing protein 2 isoform X2 n=1 Tax=Zonotrichia albicollis TaxID=44394 RepID=UPI003D80C76E
MARSVRSAPAPEVPPAAAPSRAVARESPLATGAFTQLRRGGPGPAGGVARQRLPPRRQGARSASGAKATPPGAPRTSGARAGPSASWGAWRWSSCGGERHRGPASPPPISEVDFQDSINVLGFSDELNKSLLQLYLDNRKEIRSILGELAPRLPSYHSLEWRLDVQLASRSLRQQIKPAVTMKLHLNQNEDQTAQVLQTDPATLLHLIQQLEQALGEMKMNHCRRIVRNMK